VNLYFSSDIATSISECDIIFVCVNTPTKTSGLGAGRASDLSPWESAGRSIARHSGHNKIVVEKSTVPVRTAETLAQVLALSEHKFTILSNPEFLAEGSAMHDLAHPDRVLIGGPADEGGEYATSVLVNIYRHWVPGDRIITTNLWSSELSKLVANAMLAQRVSSINAVSLICEKTGADVNEVALAVGTDSRIGKKFLNPSVGFGGSCFKKDILSLVYLCEQCGLDSRVSEYWYSILAINTLRTCSFVSEIVKCMFGSVRNKPICILGFAFKKNTSDTRESPAIAVCSQLAEEGALLKIHDPQVPSDRIHADLAGVNTDSYFVCKSPMEAVTESHAIVVLTEWDEFAYYNYTEYFGLMEKPAFVFDGRNILDHEKLRSLGFIVRGIGKSN
jgi:UDPglucose 6-dehydrogenase